MNLSELKQKTPSELSKIAQKLGIDNVANMRKQDMTFCTMESYTFPALGESYPNDANGNQNDSPIADSPFEI